MVPLNKNAKKLNKNISFVYLIEILCFKKKCKFVRQLFRKIDFLQKKAPILETILHFSVFQKYLITPISRVKPIHLEPILTDVEYFSFTDTDTDFQIK